MFSIKNLCAKHLEAFPLPAEDVEYCKYVVQGKGEERMLRGYLQLKKATSEWRVKSMLNPYSCCYAKLWKQIHLANACADLTVTSADSIVQGVLQLSGNELRKAEKVKKTGIVPRSDRERMQRLLDAKVQHVQPYDDHFRKLPKEKRLKLANAYNKKNIMDWCLYTEYCMCVDCYPNFKH